MEDTHIDAYLLLRQKHKQRYPKTIRDANNPLPFFPFNDVKWSEGLIETYASEDGNRYMSWNEFGDCGAFTLRVIEYLLSGQTTRFNQYEIGLHRLRMAVDIFINVHKVRDDQEQE
ncbi:hypothetical protein ACOSQ2_027032 [Xanthoceras sorbifolium]